MVKKINKSGTEKYGDVLESLENEMMLEYRWGECVKCKTKKHLTLHHIKSRTRYPQLATNPKNLITLCERCHRKEHEKDKRKDI